MRVLNVRNVHQALPQAIRMIRAHGIPRDSRNGPVLLMPEPVTTVYSHPQERVLFWPWRDANPFFHLMESLWMIGGRRDVDFPAWYVPRIRTYSDDGIGLRGAYGFRWRFNWGIDQINAIVHALKRNPDDRRCVLGMWDPARDLISDSKDVPCNLTATFQIHDGCLDMAVFCRSNDIIWGCYGANAVHFSMLQEYMASRIGVTIGVYEQISINWHAYTQILDDLPDMDLVRTRDDPYVTGEVSPTPILRGGDLTDPLFMGSLYSLLNSDPLPLPHQHGFFSGTVLPLRAAYASYRSKDWAAALRHVSDCESSDWRLACEQWLLRRSAAWKRAQDDGPA